MSATGGNRCIQQTAKLFLEEADALSRIHHLHVHALTQGIKHLIRCLNPGIGAEEQCFQIIEDLRREGIVTQVLQQTADESLSRFFKATAESTQPIDLLQRDVIHTPSLRGEHLR